MTPVDFLTKAIAHAKASGHIYPEYAACEAALESAWGESQLCREANNLFGQKRGPTTIDLPTISLPTKEVTFGQWKTEMAVWPKFPDWSASFAARMALLRSLSPLYKDYQMALSAPTGTGFVMSVSRKWATDPDRAKKVLEIYDRHIAGQDKVH